MGWEGGKEKDAETRRSALDGRVKAFADGERGEVNRLFSLFSSRVSSRYNRTAIVLAAANRTFRFHAGNLEDKGEKERKREREREREKGNGDMGGKDLFVRIGSMSSSVHRGPWPHFIQSRDPISIPISIRESQSPLTSLPPFFFYPLPEKDPTFPFLLLLLFFFLSLEGNFSLFPKSSSLRSSFFASGRR